MFDAHHDTDPVNNSSAWTTDPFGGEVRDGYIYGRGAVDSKGPDAAMLAACEAVVRSSAPLRGRIIFASPSDGELAMRGGDLLVDAGYADRIDAIYSAECTSLKTVDIAYPGISVWKIAVRGRAAHPTKPEEGINAIEKMAYVISEIRRQLKFRHEQWKWMEPRVTVNAVRNQPRGWEVPDHCDLIINVLSVPGMTPESMRDDIEAFLAQLRQQEPELNAEVKLIPRGFYVWRRPAEVPEDHPAVRALVDSTEKVTGTRPAISPFMGGYVPGAATSTVANRNSRCPEPPCITFGPGDFSLAHSADERIEIKELHDGAIIFAQALHRLLS
jgi:acetylornithine deacetylase/succinyl-diaminopimelate desuccinylase-like protein